MFSRLTHFRSPWALLPRALALVSALLAGHLEAATYTVTTIADTGAGSLRQAILNANAAGSGTIAFSIGTGAKTIQPLSPLPALTGDITIDGETQPGFSSDPLIELRGNLAGFGANGLSIIDTPAEISSLVINSFSGDGIRISLAAGMEEFVGVTGCWIGTSATGLAAAPNGGHGVNIVQASQDAGVTIGRFQFSHRNVISGNTLCGIYVNPIITAYVGVFNNYIGLGKDGLTPVGNGSHGVSVNPHRYVYEDDWYNIFVYRGIFIGSIDSFGGENVISANQGSGIFIPNDIYLFENQDIEISYNFIGTDATGTLDRGNGQHGIWVGEQVDVIIGTDARKIVIGGNGFSGVAANGAYTVQIKNALIGTNSAGADLGNDRHGVHLTATPGSVRFSTIAHNSQHGIFTEGGLLDESSVLYAADCHIGVSATGVAMGNGGAGIRVNFLNENNHAIIGTGSLFTTWSANKIAFNGGPGVQVLGASKVAANLNDFWANGGLAIDLGSSTGVTPNDRNDLDTGPNGLQNFPVLTFATPTRVVGSLNSTSMRRYRVDLYQAAADPTGYGEGRTHLGFQMVDLIASSSAEFVFQDLALTPGTFVTAVATPASVFTISPSTGLPVISGATFEETSEFSQNAVVLSTETGDFTFSVATFTVPEANGSQVLTVQRVGGSHGVASVAYSTAPGTAAAGTDYGAISGTLNFASGQTASFVEIPIYNDSTDEPNETLSITLHSPTGGPKIGAIPILNLTIIDDDAPALLNVADASVTEGTGGASLMTFTVSLSAPSEKALSVSWATSNGTAIAPADYVAGSGLLLFPVGTTTQTVSVSIIGDSLPEAAETFTLTLSNPLNALLGDHLATGTIVDDDVAGVLAFASAANTASETMESRAFTVVRTGGSDGAVTVAYSVTGGTATAGEDFSTFTQSGVVNFAVGQTSRTFTLSLFDDLLVEGDETVIVTLSSPTGGASIGALSSSVLTIQDDDLSPIILGRVMDFQTGTGISGAEVTISGDSEQTVITDGLGNYSFESLTIGHSYTVHVSVPGMSFAPVLRQYAPLANSAVDQDFLGSVVILPELRIETAGAGTVKLRWLASVSGWSLETTTNLATGPWTPIGGVPVVEGPWQTLTVAYVAPRGFYRLVKP